MEIRFHTTLTYSKYGNKIYHTQSARAEILLFPLKNSTNIARNTLIYRQIIFRSVHEDFINKLIEYVEPYSHTGSLEKLSVQKREYDEIIKP